MVDIETRLNNIEQKARAILGRVKQAKSHENIARTLKQMDDNCNGIKWEINAISITKMFKGEKE